MFKRSHLRESAKKSTFLNGSAIKRGRVKGLAIKKKNNVKKIGGRI